jgi:hypothetical protein
MVGADIAFGGCSGSRAHLPEAKCDQRTVLVERQISYVVYSTNNRKGGIAFSLGLYGSSGAHEDFQTLRVTNAWIIVVESPGKDSFEIR